RRPAEADYEFRSRVSFHLDRGRAFYLGHAIRRRGLLKESRGPRRLPVVAGPPNADGAEEEEAERRRQVAGDCRAEGANPTNHGSASHTMAGRCGRGNERVSKRGRWRGGGRMRSPTRLKSAIGA